MKRTVTAAVPLSLLLSTLLAFIQNFAMSGLRFKSTPEKGTPGKESYSHFVVWKGRKPGIYSSWDECNKQVSGFKYNSFKGFHSLEDANAAFYGTESGPLFNIAFEDSSSERCPNCENLSLKIKLLQIELARCKEKQHQLPDTSSDVSNLLGELGQMLEKKAKLDH